MYLTVTLPHRHCHSCTDIAFLRQAYASPLTYTSPKSTRFFVGLRQTGEYHKLTHKSCTLTTESELTTHCRTCCALPATSVRSRLSPSSRRPPASCTVPELVHLKTCDNTPRYSKLDYYYYYQISMGSQRDLNSGLQPSAVGNEMSAQNAANPPVCVRYFSPYRPVDVDIS